MFTLTPLAFFFFSAGGSSIEFAIGTGMGVGVDTGDGATIDDTMGAIELVDIGWLMHSGGIMSVPLHISDILTTGVLKHCVTTVTVFPVGHTIHQFS